MNNALLGTAGIVLFLYGTVRLSAGVERLLTARIRDYLRYIVKRPLFGLMTGMGTTVLFQSSSASTALTVGMVSAGLIGFRDSLAVILGTDIGTTFVVQLVVWRITDLSPLFICAGGLLYLLGRDRTREVGEMVLQFGMIFFGLGLLGTAAAPLRDHPGIVAHLRDVPDPLTGFAAGAVITALIHASAIPISILVILAQQDLVGTYQALPVVFGANVGTTVTAIMAAAVTGPAGKRTAAAHVLFKVTGACVCMAVLPQAVRLLQALSTSVSQQIALAHLLFNLLITFMFFPFLDGVARLLERFIPGREEEVSLWPEYLKDEDLADADRALGAVRKELARQMGLVERVFAQTLSVRRSFSEGRLRHALLMEMAVNHLRGEIVSYLRNLSYRMPAAAHPRAIFAYTALADDIERMANHMMALMELSRIKKKRRILFSSFAEEELDEIEALVGENITDARRLLEGGDGNLLQAVGKREEMVDLAVKEAREKHIVRFHRRLCRAEAGPVFIEMLIRLERISDHCQNMAEHVAELGPEDKGLAPARTS